MKQMLLLEYLICFRTSNGNSVSRSEHAAKKECSNKKLETFH